MKKQMIALIVGIAMCFSQMPTVMAEDVPNVLEKNGKLLDYSTSNTEAIWNFEDDYTLAVGCEAKLVVDNLQYGSVQDYSVRWEVENSGIASVQEGIVHALAEGETKVRAVCTYSYYDYSDDYNYGDDYDDYDEYDDYDDYYYDDYYYGSVYDISNGGKLVQNTQEIEYTLHVTNPHWKKNSVGMNLYSEWDYSDWGEASVDLEGISYDSNVSFEKVKNLEIDCSGTTIYFSTKKSGTYKVTVTVDGKTLEPFTVYAYKLYFKRNSKTTGDANSKKWMESQSVVGLYKGETTTLIPKGFAKGSKIKWKSSKPSIVSVSQKGKIKAKSNGNAIITASNDRGSISYNVAVSYKSAVKAIRYATKHFNSTYSQEKRMSKGYYDCSSYVWRAYKDAGYALGNSKNYAPTAADLAKWCVQKGYKISEGEINVKKLQPGDLIFSMGENNGRYKGIYHVDLYVGGDVTMTVARTKSVYWYGDQALVARPCKGHK